MPRSTKEWRGKTDDTQAPPRVRLRVFDRDNGVCHWCKTQIKAPVESWQADHVIAIINGGENRETNLAPIHGHCHVEKTGEDIASKKKVAEVRKKHLGVVKPKGSIASRPKAPKLPGKPPLPPRRMFSPLHHGEEHDH